MYTRHVGYFMRNRMITDLDVRRLVSASSKKAKTGRK